MYPSEFYSDVIRNIKASTSCVDLCRFSLGLPVSYSGQAIHAPDFIRQGDSHKSFAVYIDHAYDFSTGKSYDIFELLMLAKGLTFAQAFHEISGSPLSSYLPKSSPDHDVFRDNIDRLEHNIKDWHNTLLSNKNALDYLAQRGISKTTILKLFLGYDPKTNRIIIPFFKNGKPRYFAGRDLSGQSERKYLYMPTDWGCVKIPFGLQSVKAAYKKRQTQRKFSDIDNECEDDYIKSSTLVLTEGLIDSIILIQDGWTCLASGGGSFGANNNQLVLDIAKMYDRVCLAYDNDDAGRNFQLRMARWLLGEQIPFTCASIPHLFNGHVVKDINDYYLAGGNFLDLAKSAQSGVVFCSNELNTIREVYEFVQSIAGYATEWDMHNIFVNLSQRTKGSILDEEDPEHPENKIAVPLFSKGDLRAAFRAAGTKITDKELIRRVLKEHQLIYSTDGRFYEYNHRYWEKVTNERVKRYISRILGEKATEGRCGSVMSLMRSELEDDTPFNEQHVVTFRNGVLLLDEPDPDKRFVPHSPDFRCTFMEDFTYDTTVRPKARKSYGSVLVETEGDYYNRLRQSQWWKFLSSVFPLRYASHSDTHPDTALIREVQKMCGYIYFTTNRLERTFILLGKGGNGKSTLMQIIEEVVGSDFCTHLRPNRLASSFDPIVLRNSILNICHEASKDLEGAEETLKAVTSGNPIMASYKGMDTISFTPRAKWIISANSPMDVKDVSYGFSRRMVFIPFETKFDEAKKDTEMLDKLRQEKSLIFSWMYEGYLILKHGEKFADTPEQAAKRAEVQEIIDHTLTFVREYFIEGDYVEALDSMPGNPTFTMMHKLPTDRVMYQWYLKWCKSTNTQPLPRHVAIVRINDALKVKCPAMKMMRALDQQIGRERLIYVMPEFAGSLESTSIYDADTQDAILEVFNQGKGKDSKITRQDE